MLVASDGTRAMCIRCGTDYWFTLKVTRAPLYFLSRHMDDTQEVRALNRCRELAIRTPALFFADPQRGCLYLEYFVDAMTVRDYIYAVGATPGSSHFGIDFAHGLAWPILGWWGEHMARRGAVEAEALWILTT